MLTDDIFDDIRPFNDDEMPEAISFLSKSQEVANIVDYLYPDKDNNVFMKKLSCIKTIDELQMEIVFPIVRDVLKKTTSAVVQDGLNKLSKEKSYLFISCHRDIVMDPCILEFLLVDNGFKTSSISFGDNLLLSPALRYIAKCNKMFTVKRGDSLKNLLQHSKVLSMYIRNQITQENQSVWIAQRGGRTKDGNDRTDQGILKMFFMSKPDDFVGGFNEVNVVPIAISYEYEPCAFFKVNEVYNRRRGPYVKKNGEDYISIKTGIQQYKGNVAFDFCNQLTEEELSDAGYKEKNMRFIELADIIDKRIIESYKLWKNNYIAYDLLNVSDHFSDKYSLEDKKIFVEYMENGLCNLCGDYDELKDIFLHLYANPVINKNFIK